jgi:hypothetical protein
MTFLSVFVDDFMGFLLIVVVGRERKRKIRINAEGEE